MLILSGVAAAKSLVGCMATRVEAFAFGMFHGTCESHAVAAFLAVIDVRKHLTRGKVLQDAAIEAIALDEIVVARARQR